MKPAAPLGETALVLSAGAPTLPLIAGALHAFYEEDIRFSTIYASGAGALAALVLIAPKVDSPERIESDDYAKQARLDALARLPRLLGVSDDIYRYVPLGYKTFVKHGPYAAPFRSWARHFKLGRDGAPATSSLARRVDKWLNEKALVPSEAPAGTLADPAVVEKWTHVYNDWVDLAAACMTPLLLTPGSRGLCAPFPFLEELVDFDLLRRWKGKLYMPAYDVTPTARHPNRLVQFTNAYPVRSDEKRLRGAAEFRACLAGPFIYPPATIDGQVYTEGAFQDPQNVRGWLDDLERKAIDNVIILDTLGTGEMEEILLRPPQGLWDAYGLSILTGAVGAARAQRKVLEEALAKLKAKREAAGQPQPSELHRTISWDLPPELHRGITDWNYGNLLALFDHGRCVIGGWGRPRSPGAGACYLEAGSRRFPGGVPNRDLLKRGSFIEYTPPGEVAHP